MNREKKYKTIFLWLIIFGIGMGILEYVVVIYLRDINYPGGFEFPLKITRLKYYNIEIIREFATIIMLVSIGFISGKNLLEKFCYFIFSFATWDIFYYIGLKFLINWPPSLLTWDILFLIPVTWVGPVLAPVICSVVFIFFSVAIIILKEKGYIEKLNLISWLLFISGSFIIFIIFIRDYSKIMIENGFLSHPGILMTDEKFISIISNYVPDYFNWYLFICGELLIISPLILIYIKEIKMNKINS